MVETDVVESREIYLPGHARMTSIQSTSLYPNIPRSQERALDHPLLWRHKHSKARSIPIKGTLTYLLGILVFAPFSRRMRVFCTSVLHPTEPSILLMPSLYVNSLCSFAMSCSLIAVSGDHIFIQLPRCQYLPNQPQGWTSTYKPAQFGVTQL
jgi:hypothetical protein